MVAGVFSFKGYIMTKHDTPQQARETAMAIKVGYVLHVELPDDTTTYIAAKIDHATLNRANLSIIRNAIATIYDLDKEVRDAEAKAKARLIAVNVPGHAELLDAYRQRALDYESNFSAMQNMMADEYNDGARPPILSNIDHDTIVKKLEAKYPKAKVYIACASANPSTITGYGDCQAADALLHGSTIAAAQTIINTAIDRASKL